MEATCSVQKRKRCSDVSRSLCIICQEKKKTEVIRASTPQGLKSVREATSKRGRYNCDKYVDSLDRLKDNDLSSEDVKWHKSCFSSFTSSRNISLLQKRYERSCEATPPQMLASCRPNIVNPPRTTRQLVSPVDWGICMFCQVSGGTTSQVLTLETSAKIMDGAKYDFLFGRRIANITDLVAAEGKYHLSCYTKFFKRIAKLKINTEISSEFNPACFSSAMQELEEGIQAGHVYSVNTVWERYCEMVDTCQSSSVPLRSSNTLRDFRKNIERHFGDKIEMVVQERKRDSLLIFPNLTKKTLLQRCHKDAAERSMKETENILLRSFSETDVNTELLRSMSHVSSMIKSDMKEAAGHGSYDGLDEEHAQAVVPENLFLLLSLIIGDNESEERRQKILSIAQDIIFVASNGKKLTPKHIGLAVTVHHATRSKSLVQLLHSAGHCVSYECVKRIDATMAKKEVERWKSNGDLVIPPNLKPGDFVQFSGDNINVHVETLDGKGMLNATQYAAFQYGEGNKSTSDDSKIIGKEKSIGSSIPPEFHAILPSGYMRSKRPSPVFPDMDIAWYGPDPSIAAQSHAKDLAWIQCRLQDPSQQVIPAWTGFNHVTSQFESEVTSVGYMPIIPAPADDTDTVYTVIARCKRISETLGQHHTVITFDQALYYKAKELVWLKPAELQDVIVRLGGFHTAMNFLKAIGQHMEAAGLKDVWVESGVYGENTTCHMLAGKAYNKAMRGHKLTHEALWRILWPKFLSWVTDNGKSLGVDEEHVKQVISDFSNRDIESVTASFEKLVDESSHILELLDEYDSTQSTNSTFRFWRQYMGMVSILLGFIRADREGDWKLHLYFFAKMLPWFALYDHVNYARWGPIYLADMSQLETSAPQVYSEFMKGKFSIKRTNKKFCQIASDQALEHINRVAKVSGGIVGITRLDSARDTWCITYNERAKASDDTLAMFGLQLEDENVDWHHRDTGPAGLQRDEQDIAKIISEFLRFGMFSQSGDALICLTTNDVAPEDVANELLSAEVKGQALVEGFVNDRLIDKTTDFYSTLKQNKTKTLASIYKVKVATDGGKHKTVQADRDLFRRLLVAAESGRNVKFEDILQHELSPTPLSLSDSSGKLLSTEKKDLGDILTSGLAVDNKLPDSTLRTCMVIDAPALIQAIGKPNDITTFGQLGDIFVKNVMSHFKSCTRIDVLFDRYIDLSIKSGTRSKRTGTFRPIRRVIDNVNVKLPLNWKQFISLPENKADLARFLTEQLMDSADKVPSGCELITAGGFDDLLGAWSSTDGDVEQLRGNHEEADTRLILHAADACKVGYGRTIISCRDTDVLVIALHFIDILSKEVWMRAGTSKDRKYIPIHQITLPEPVIRSIIGFHALTGCDSTSQFAGKGKKTAWKVFVEKDNASLLKDLGEDSASLGEDKVKAIEKFICHMYSYEKCESVNQVRLKIFVKGKKSLNGLPPTQDALHKHIARAHYQSLVWRQSLVASQKLPSPTISGWKEVNGELVPDLLSLDPVPSVCEQLVTCSCKTGCTLRCGCAGKKLLCTSGCECAGSCQNPYNSY